MRRVRMLLCTTGVYKYILIISYSIIGKVIWTASIRSFLRVTCISTLLGFILYVRTYNYINQSEGRTLVVINSLFVLYFFPIRRYVLIYTIGIKPIVFKKSIHIIKIIRRTYVRTNMYVMK